MPAKHRTLLAQDRADIAKRHPNPTAPTRPETRLADVASPARLQRLVGNAVTARLIQSPLTGPARLPAPALRRALARTAVVQRHTQGVLDKINDDLVSRRPTLRGYDATSASGDLLEYINKHVNEISKLPGMVTVCASKDDLKVALAKDLAARAGSTTVTADHERSAANDVDNGGGGFTALDGTVYMLESTNDSSALYHELIHVLSAPGGTTQLSKTKINLNEGFTNYFAEELSTKYKKATFPAYPAATAWVRKFATKYGRDVAYNVYFKDNEALLYSTLATTLRSNVEEDKKIHDGNAKDNTKNPTRFTAAALKTMLTGADVKDVPTLAELIKKKIIASDFLSADEPNLKWLDTGVFN